MSADAEKSQQTSLARQSAQQLGAKASLVARGLRDITQRLLTGSAPPAERRASRGRGHVDRNGRYVVCEECDTDYAPGSLEILPISEALRFELWPDDMKMFFCPACDSYVLMSPPYINEE
jgi:hypothetical protein